MEGKFEKVFDVTTDPLAVAVKPEGGDFNAPLAAAILIELNVTFMSPIRLLEVVWMCTKDNPGLYFVAKCHTKINVKVQPEAHKTFKTIRTLLRAALINTRCDVIRQNRIGLWDITNEATVSPNLVKVIEEIGKDAHGVTTEQVDHVQVQVLKC